MDYNQKSKTLKFTSYAVLDSIIVFISLASIPWIIFIAWGAPVIGFLVWVILLTIADRYRGADKKAVYKSNQIILLVLLLIVIDTLFSTLLR